MAEAAPAIAALLAGVNIAGKAIKKVKARKAAKKASLAAICEDLHKMIAAMNEAQPHYNEQDKERAEAAMRLALLCEAEVKKWMCSPATASVREQEVKMHLEYVEVISENAHSRRRRAQKLHVASESIGHAGSRITAVNAPHDVGGSPDNGLGGMPPTNNEGSRQELPYTARPQSRLRTISYEDVGRIRFRAECDSSMDVEFRAASPTQPLSFHVRQRPAPESTRTEDTHSEAAEEPRPVPSAFADNGSDSSPVFASMGSAAAHLANKEHQSPLC